jgi:hypothetical protein
MVGATMSKKRVTQLERNLKSGPGRKKRQPIGISIKWKAKDLARLAAMAERRKHKH